ncbi:MAG: formate dehydrogenase accessory protein FdhE [Chloroflexi bacterium]|nr:formate dehydrogenase accessory protein FdhE [Chloroflexota bacterium]
MAALDERVQLLDRRLAVLRKARPDLQAALDLQEALMRASLSPPRTAQAHPFPLPRDQVDARLRAGVPLLHEQPAFVDVHFAADVFSRLVNVLQQREDAEVSARLERVVVAATTGTIDPQRLFGEAFVRHADHLVDIALESDVDAELLSTLATQAAAPLLRAYAERLLPQIQRLDDGSTDGAIWQKGYCPVCGGWPVLGELRGIELALFLRCAACGSGWRSRRMFCPYCGNDDHQSLHMLTIAGEQRFRISVCERCQGYLKVGNAFDPPPADLLAIDDVASMHLDVAAIERGYHRPEGAGFVIELAVPEDEWVDELEDA